MREIFTAKNAGMIYKAWFLKAVFASSLEGGDEFRPVGREFSARYRPHSKG